MIDPEAGDRGSENDLRARIAEVVRHDLAAEADAGFALLRRFPNSETAGIPDYIARLGEVERDALLDALAHYCTLWVVARDRSREAGAASPRPLPRAAASLSAGRLVWAGPRKARSKRP